LPVRRNKKHGSTYFNLGTQGRKTRPKGGANATDDGAGKGFQGRRAVLLDRVSRSLAPIRGTQWERGEVRDVERTRVLDEGKTGGDRHAKDESEGGSWRKEGSAP